MSLFAVTRGQWSMIDAVLAVIDACPVPVDISLWTWTVADYEIQTLTRLRIDQRIASGRLIIDAGARTKNAAIIADWKRTFGPDSVRYVVNHAKIARVSCAGRKFLMRGSMNLNMNPRFEQFDLTEGGEDFDLVERIESELPILTDSASNAQARAASNLNSAFAPETLEMFAGLKRWAK